MMGIMDKENDTSNEDREIDYNLLQGKLLSHPPPGEEIVISGISGSFPLTENILEFQENLYEKKIMLTGNSRWDFSHAEIPAATGAVPGAEKFDAGYFGIHERQSHSLDAMGRMVLEKTMEAIFDAGLHPSDFENSKTGVYIGTCFSETEKYSFFDSLNTQNFAYTGAVRSMIAHRVSYFLKLKGPSFVSDTACSSSFYAFEPAFRALRLGEIDTAIVAGANLCLHPFVSLQFARLGVLSKDGVCKAFDEAADGYVRSEVIGVLILQRAKDCKRNYAEIIHVKTNCDGFKPTGITFPSKDSQFALMKEVYEESGVNPASLSYLEAHGTGTGIGDPEECGAIDELLTEGRTTPLLMGSVKSNIGHAEPASGIGSIIKCIIAMENGFIPPNINFNTPNKRIRGIIEGRLKVVTEKTPFEDDRGLIGVNSFGFGGGNCHLLMKSNKKEKVNKGCPTDKLPRLVLISARTNEAVVHMMDDLKNNPLDAEHIRLLHEVYRKNIDNHLYRGFLIVSKYGEICRFSEKYQRHQEVPFYITFGELENWCEIGNDLMDIPIFYDTLQRIQKKLSAKKVDIIGIMKNISEEQKRFQALGSAIVQIGLIDIMKTLDIVPKFHFGYSYGEMLSAYFDDYLSLEETVDCVYEINRCINSINGWSFKNSGDEKKTDKDIGIHPTNGSILENFRLALCSNNITTTRKLLNENLSNIIKPKPTKTKKSIESFATAEYFIEAMSAKISQNFLEGLEKESILLNIGSFPIESDIEGVKSITCFPSGSTNYLVDFLRILGNLYVNGHHPKVASLYPEVKFPVSRGTRMISPHIKWKHDRNWFVPVYNVHQKAMAEQRGSRKVEIQTTDLEWAYADGHVIDGRNLFPATAYLYLVWETLCIIDDMPMNIRDVVFENCKFLRATSLPAKGYVTYYVSINKSSGSFEINEGDYPVVTGKISTFDENINEISKTYRDHGSIDTSKLELTTKDVYKELRLRGYNYKGAFRSIVSCDVQATNALIKWDKNWVTFLDNMLQMKILHADSRLLYVPTYISYLRIPAKAHLEWVLQAYINKDKPTILPVFNNNRTNTISCGEIELKGLIASSIPRRKDLGIPVLERYAFIPNVTTLTLEQSIRVNMQILLENALVYKVKSVEIIDESTKEASIPISPIVKAVFEDQPLIQPILKILTKNQLETSVPVEDKNITEETDNLLVVASNLLERPELLKAVLRSLKDNGFIISREPSDFDPAMLKEHDLHLYTSHKTGTETLVFLRKPTKSKTPFVLKISPADEFSWIPTLKDQLKTKKADDVILYSQNDSTSGILGLVNCLRREPDSTNCRCLFLMDDVEEFNMDSPFYAEQLQKNMAINIHKNGLWGTYRHLLIEDAEKVEREHCFVNTAIRGDLSSLTWFEGPLGNLKTLSCEKKLVHVYYSALNFRDIMTASGRISNDVITGERIEQECVQGFEFSGIDSSGNRVMGMINHGALSTLVQSDNYLTFKVPDGMSLKDAATIPIVYTTVIYSLLLRGNMKRGDSILIHSGTGGVGQAAIRIALYYGCKVYTTVGNEAKRDFLKKTFPQLKDQHIGNSHDLSFEKAVMRDTRGRGVDLVLNSLAEEKLQTSLRCVARGGRFLEIGKFDLANNNLINLRVLRREVTFHGIMLDQFLTATPSLKRQIAEVFEGAMAAGYVKPLDATVFGYDQVEEAFRFMATGKHMGKVLVKIREEENGHGGHQPIAPGFSCKPRYLCDPNKTYIIIGGLGGFGLELADWLVLRGAKKLVLTSRSGVRTGYQKSRIKCWKSYGTEILISQDDITSRDGCRSLIEQAQKLGEVTAVFNLAVVLADALFENQTEENFVTSFGPKPVATQFMDEITRKLCPNLRDFVIFSSVTCGRGNAGQTNYGMANCVMERICERRKQDGFPALAIQWGAIGEVGLVAEMQEKDCELEIGGTLQQRISSCLKVLDGFLANREATIVSSMVVAEKRGASEKAENIVQAVLNILGLNSAKSISHHCSLPELGMDSMTAVEIKQVLERDFEVFLSPKDMRTMTLAKLKKIQEERDHGTKEETVEKENGGLDAFFRISLIEDHQALSQIQLKSGDPKNRQKSLIFPGIDGFVKIFQPMANQIQGEVIGLQYGYNKNCTTIQNIAENLLPVVEEHLSKDDKTFNIIAYSFGSIVALEAAHILESKGYVGNIAVVDGSPVMFKQVLIDLDCFSPESERLLQTIILCNLLALYISSEVISQQKESIYRCESWDERLDVCVRIMGDKSSYDIDYQKSVATGIYDRTRCLMNYTPSYAKVKSKVKLFCATNKSFSYPEEDYGLSGICEHPVEVESFDGSHNSILDNEALGTAIDSWMRKNSKSQIES
ncbi:unnamed protein product [Phaedon cochleariae]|uniref:Uncharacterized protein n=1 Tax=Phaedon cochleariae TaxID=80249 RepID=A0A9N9X3F5_PHACE|nr:unnamed protein product [Phaedon cochleariae]